jgi:hypothetical protein
MPKIVPHFLLMALALSAALVAAPTDPAPSGKKPGFNKSEIQALYCSGEFDPLLALLENLRQQRRLRDREDSVFIFKYLGVVYGADDATRKKAESFLYQLLKLDPKADLADLVVGESIETIFNKVRERYEKAYRDTTFDRQREIILQQWAADSLRRDSLRQAEAADEKPAPAATTEKASPEPAKNRRRMWIWAAAGGGAVLATAGLILAFSGEPEKQVDTVLTPIR